jgi:hypothetical protein
VQPKNIKHPYRNSPKLEEAAVVPPSQDLNDKNIVQDHFLQSLNEFGELYSKLAD